MKTYIKFLILLFGIMVFTFCNNPVKEEAKEETKSVDKMDWWKEAKFGMFIHWGVYAVPAGTYKGHKIKHIGEWIMNRGKIPVMEYKEYAKSFNPVKYDPEAWVKMAKDAGMQYIVITSKHHDGFALFDSKVTDWDMVDATPYGKDVIGPLVKACKKEGIRIGLYYSQAQDWCHPGGAASRKLAKDGWENPDSAQIDKYTKEHRGHWDPAQNGDMDKYLDEISVPQVKEILTNYGEIDILWWDTPTGMTKERAEKFLPIIAEHPNLITNNRLGGGYKGDLETPEQYIPPTGYPGRNWEVCMTMNDTWGYKSYDDNWKSEADLILKLSEIVSKGGNFLLNVGPTAEGEIPQPSIERLKKVGEWMKVNHEAIYGTTASPFHYLPWGRATLKGQKLYLHVLDWPEDGVLKVPLQNKVQKAYLLADPKTSLKVKNKKNRVDISVPANALDPVVSIVVLEYEGQIEVLPIPTEGKQGTASSTDESTKVSNLFDGNMKNRWKAAPGEKSAWIEVDLGEPVEIGYFSIMEPWRPWHHKSQKFELQVKEGEDWKTIADGKTKGTGYSQEIEPVTGRYFRLLVTGPDGKEPELNEWILYRAI
jgi:alpha-L-fucosidase